MMNLKINYMIHHCWTVVNRSRLNIQIQSFKLLTMLKMLMICIVLQKSGSTLPSIIIKQKIKVFKKMRKFFDLILLWCYQKKSVLSLLYCRISFICMKLTALKSINMHTINFINKYWIFFVKVDLNLRLWNG